MANGIFEARCAIALDNTRIAVYVNETAPTGGGTKVAKIKPDGKIVFVAKSVGDTPIDIVGAETNRHCTLFTGCKYRQVFDGTGAKIACRSGAAAACP